jgi:hypothetical protein
MAMSALNGPMTAKRLQAELWAVRNLHIPVQTLRKILKNDLKFIYKRIRRGEPYHNTELNITLRQHYARVFVDVLHSGKRAIHIDASPWSSTDYCYYSW